VWQVLGTCLFLAGEDMVERVHWRQVWGLAIFMGASTFCWLAYGFYQPLILTQLGFTGLASTLAIFQGLLGAIVEPGAGFLADRYANKIGRKLPLITIGITLAGLIFVVLSGLLTMQIPMNLRWIVPVLMTVWTLAMIVFRGPAVALLVQMVPAQTLPQANSILIWVVSLVGAVAPVFDKIIAWLGAPLTFLLGAVILAGGRFFLTTTPPNLTTQIQKPRSRSELPQYPSILWIYGIGLICGILVNLLLRWSPQFLIAKLGGIEVNTLTAIILGTSALWVWFVKGWVQRWGTVRSMQSATGLIVILLLLAPLMPNGGLAIGYLILAGLAFCLLSSAQIPWVLQQLAQPRLATGLYFGGMGLATAIVSMWLLQVVL
jgi:MFS family permease